MSKVTFKIPGVEGDYHIPLLNFEQQDRIMETAPRFLGMIGAEGFDFTNKENLLTAFLQLVTTGAIFKKLSAALICPAERDYYLDAEGDPEGIGDYARNMKIASRIPITHLFEGYVGEDKKPALRLGVLGQSFLASNSNWVGPLGSLTTLLSVEPVSEESKPDSPDSSTATGEASTG